MNDPSITAIRAQKLWQMIAQAEAGEVRPTGSASRSTLEGIARTMTTMDCKLAVNAPCVVALEKTLAEAYQFPEPQLAATV